MWVLRAPTWSHMDLDPEQFENQIPLCIHFIHSQSPFIGSIIAVHCYACLCNSYSGSNPGSNEANRGSKLWKGIPIYYFPKYHKGWLIASSMNPGAFQRSRGGAQCVPLRLLLDSEAGIELSDTALLQDGGFLVLSVHHHKTSGHFPANPDNNHTSRHFGINTCSICFHCCGLCHHCQCCLRDIVGSQEGSTWWESNGDASPGGWILVEVSSGAAGQGYSRSPRFGFNPAHPVCDPGHVICEHACWDLRHCQCMSEWIHNVGGSYHRKHPLNYLH